MVFNISDSLERASLIACGEAVETPVGGAVFFSSGRGRNKALHFCKQEEGRFTTILDTAAWRALSEEGWIGRASSFDLDTQLALKNIVCERFARAAAGNVTVFFNPKRPFGTFFDTELPILLENKNVQTINALPKGAFAGFLEFRPDSAPARRDASPPHRDFNFDTPGY